MRGLASTRGAGLSVNGNVLFWTACEESDPVIDPFDLVH